MSRFMPRSQGGFVTLIELLVVAVIIFLLAYVFLKGGGPASRQVEEELGPARPGGPTTVPGRSIEAARAVDCKSNLRQIRTALQMFMMETDKPPASLRELAGYNVSPKMTRCPVTGDPYHYDPQTGKVNCTVQGHEGY
jgi:hypothetical protein